MLRSGLEQQQLLSEAYYNVTINLKDVSDEAFRLTQRRVSELLQEAKDSVASILDAAENRT
uniref:Cyclodeaminase/cyclohydrolase domain-containing protein n=1 Tax=Xiphophorus maculatus TaxID=8083 RepID=A0A3B5PZD0_XIPMA